MSPNRIVFWKAFVYEGQRGEGVATTLHALLHAFIMGDDLLGDDVGRHSQAIL